jgi:hypothetical protein
MKPRDAFSVWAPADSTWSPWAKPVLFTALDTVTEWAPPISPLAAEQAAPLAAFRDKTALVLDLPAAAALELSLQLTQLQFRPVPVLNTTFGPDAVLPMQTPVELLRRGASLLEQTHLAPNAPPAFVLDSGRQPTTVPAAPGKYDNRWVVFPQDFPSAQFLRRQGIERVLLIQSHGGTPRDDLAHVLLRWQEDGLAILLLVVSQPPARPLKVNRPPRYRSFWYRLLTAMGLKRNSAGGFGSAIPTVTASHSSGFG